MAVDGSSVAIQVGTAVKFPLASNCGQRFVYSVKFSWLWFFFLQQGVIPVPARVPTSNAIRLMCVFSALSWQQGALRRILPCVFSAPSNTTGVKSCGVAVGAMYPLLAKLFLLLVARMQWFCLPDFECLLSPFLL